MPKENNLTKGNSVKKGGGITMTFAIIFLLLLAYPFLAVVVGDYESDMAMTTVFFGLPCAIMGTIAGLIGIMRGHQGCAKGLALIWIPILAAITLSMLTIVLG